MDPARRVESMSARDSDQRHLSLASAARPSLKQFNSPQVLPRVSRRHHSTDADDFHETRRAGLSPGRIGDRRRVNLFVADSVNGQLRAEDPQSKGDSATEQDVTSRLEFFEQKVRPILEESCWKCHATEHQRGGLRLDHREFILRGGDSGPAVDLEDNDGSLLLNAVEYQDFEMPPQGQLPQVQREILRKWVEGGLTWPDEPVPAEVEADSGLVVTDDDRQHWAYRPVPANVDVPKVASDEWSRNPIDRFILAKLHANGLTHSRRANRRQLLRRLHYDLTGLPPTADQVRQFEDDETPDAYTYWVDRLLAEPAVGEKWGRHWLDLVRYAETNGYERDGAKPNAWRYRDYVIRAFNSGKPYDQFLREQLAGDEMHFDESDWLAKHDALIATGFYRLGVWDDEPADADQAFYDSLDDVLSTTSMVTMATTVGCARCHDHKIDPVPQADYYRLLAFFRNIYNNSQQGRFKKSAFTLNTLAQIASPEQLAEHDRRRREFQVKLDQLQASYDQLESEVYETLSNPEKEDAADQGVRRQLVEDRAEKVLGARRFAEFEGLKRQLQRLKRRGLPPLPHALVVRENGREAPATHVLIRGNAHAPGDEVVPAFPQVMMPVSLENEPLNGSVVSAINLPNQIPSSGRRTAFAQWLTDPNHPLTARVIVNRFWQHHFGRGICRTTSDFGKYGDRPTHPELLDHLAQELIRHDWDLKWLHRVMVTSETYQMASSDREECLQVDPENNLFWRFNMRRLTAEELRDTVLSVNGQLNRQMGGPSVYSKIPDVIRQSASRPDAAWGNSTPANQVRRSVYVFVKRSVADPVLQSFDAADTDGSCPVRFTTTVPTQSLTTLNGEFFNEQAAVFATRLQHEAGDSLISQVELAFRLTLAREPTATELNRGVELINDWQQKDGLSVDRARAYFCLLMLNLNEMIYLD